MSQQFVGANNGLRLLTFIISPPKKQLANFISSTSALRMDFVVLCLYKNDEILLTICILDLLAAKLFDN